MDNEVYRGVIASDMSSSTQNTHITSDMCSPTRETRTTPDMCFCSGMCFPYPVTILSADITRDVCSRVGETHFTRDVCFLSRGTHITSGMCFPGKEHVSLVISVPLRDDLAILS